MQEGGAVTFEATEDKPAVLPNWANCAGDSHAHVTWSEPPERTKWLLTTLLERVNLTSRRKTGHQVARQWLRSWNAAHVLVRQSSLR